MESLEPHPVPVPPTLRTLGTLRLPGSPLTRPKPLLLLAFLAHEGPTDRDRLARLFFARSRDPRDALSTTLRRIAGFAEPVGPMDERLRATIATDALEFQRLAIAEEPEVALARYQGTFLQGVPMGSGVEADEWIVSAREHFGSIARDLRLDLARRELDRDRSVVAWHHAKHAIALTEAFVLEPEPTAHVLSEFDAAGLRVPESWWRAVAALGFERPPSRHRSTTARTGDRAEATAENLWPTASTTRRPRSLRVAVARTPRRPARRS